VLRRGDPPAWTALFDPHAWDRALAMAELVPDLGHAVGFECRLAAGADVVDLGLRLRRPAVAAGSRVAPRAVPEATVPIAWQRLGELCRRWGDPDTDLYGWVRLVFLEFDADTNVGSVPVPSVFLTLDWPADPDGDRGVSEPFAAARSGLAVLRGGSLPAAVHDRLERCFRALPPGGRVVHIGAMLGRAADWVRLSIAMPRTVLVTYLASIGFPGSIDAIETAVHHLTPAAVRVQIECDVRETVAARLGLVLADGSGRAPSALLDRLVADGLCAPPKRAALLAWPGRFTGRLPGHARPRELQRNVSHIKVTHAPGEAPSAKAYLAITSPWPAP